MYGAQLPQDWLDAIQELLGTYLSANMVVTVLDSTHVQLAATTDNGQISLAINGKWRYNASAVNATHPGGGAGIYALWATSADNNFAIGPPEVDSTVYTFALEIRASGTPVTALSRQIGVVEWNGSAITRASLITDDPATRGTLEPGDLIWSAAATRSGALICDGASYLRTAFPALFAALGGASSTWGLPDGTHFNVPDLRGRTLVGVGTGAGLTARAAGATGGAETVTLTGAQSGVPTHTHPSGGAAVGTTTASATGNDAPDHTHSSSAGFLTSGHGSTLVGAGGTSAFFDNVGTAAPVLGGANVRHQHSIPSLSVSVTDPATPINNPANAASAHENMPPWVAGYIFIKV